ncbi:MAG: non-canonical purine NTP pyrophosphatase [Nanoarchaeota archaeon]
MKVMLGTGNKEKIKDWKNSLVGYEVILPADLGIILHIEEGKKSLNENAIKKAEAYAREAGILTISEDTGFFIEDLGGEPGIAAKRWGGELPEDTLMDVWIKHLKSKVKGISVPKGYFETSVAIADGNGFVRVANEKIHGRIDIKRLNALKAYRKQHFILPYEFIFDKTGKSWSEMSFLERKNIYLSLRGFIKKSIKEYFFKKSIKLTIIGPRSVGKSTVAKELAKKLNAPYFSSDELMNIKTSHLGGLDKTIKSRKMNELIKQAIPCITEILSKNKFIYDLAGGAVTSRRFPIIARKIGRLIQENSFVIGLIPSPSIKDSIEFLFSREKMREHFKNMNADRLRLMVSKDCKKYFQPAFLNTCDLVVYVKDKSKKEIVNEIICFTVAGKD